LSATGRRRYTRSTVRRRLASTALLLALALPVRAAPPAAAGPAGPPPAALRAAVDALMERSALAGARVGICVVSLDTGATLYTHDADALLNPASNVKLFTSAAALARLGPEYRFETEAWLDAAGLSGGAARALYLRGKGDPTLTTERLWVLAGDLAHLGLKRLGDLVLDEGWFDAERVGAGFDQESGDKSYLAPTGALSLNFNSVAVHVAPADRPGAAGRVELEPDSAYFELSNRTRTVGARAARRLTVSSTPGGPGGRQRIVVEGRLPAGGRPAVSWRKIDDPAQYLGQTLRRLLELRGIRMTGVVRLGAVPEGARLFHVVESEPLSEVVRRLNKSSNNFMAEQLLKALGAATAGPPGSWASGLSAVEGFLASFGLPRGSYVMKNGSGLNDANRFSARQTARLLAELWRRFPVSAEFLASLPLSGKDGTIRWRLEGPETAGRVRAKTGTLDGVNSLSGYLETVDGERLAFAILVNDAPGRAAAVTPAIDAVAAALVRRGAPAAAAAVAAGPGVAARPAVVVGPGLTAGPAVTAGGDTVAVTSTATPEALDAAASSYLALGRARDRRNVSFLRTALRAETEPQLRLAVAEALYRSDPDADAARRGLLEATAAPLAPPPLARLLALALAGEPPPVVAGLGDLAGEGNGEAISRLLALAAAEPPAPLRAALAAVLGEVADAAPTELRLALLAAAAPARQAAEALLGDRLPLLPAAPAPATMGPATTGPGGTPASGSATEPAAVRPGQ
jgi:D-alanyl-D-alanine carboxypeptidase/D-alanyl-D-alanine-endopeptidase (penicillin-binding protein 4)